MSEQVVDANRRPRWLFVTKQWRLDSRTLHINTEVAPGRLTQANALA